MNEFDKGIGQRYVETYAPMPLEALTRLAMRKQATYNNALNDIESTKGLLNINADPANYDYRDKLVSEFNKELNDIAQETLKRGWTPDLQSRFLNFKNQALSNPDRLRLEEQYKDYKLYEKDKGSQVSKNTYLDDLDNYPKQGDPNKLTPWSYNGLQELQDYNKTAQDVMGSIRESGYNTKGIKFDDSGNIIGYESGKEGVASQTLRTLSNMKAEQFMLTPAGKQYIARLLKVNPDVDIYKAAEEYIYNANAQKIGLKTNTGNSFNYAPGYIAKKQNANLTESSESEGINNSTLSQDLFDGMSFTKDGNLNVPEIPSQPLAVDDKGAVIEWSKPGKDLNKMAKQVALIETIKREHPDLKDLTPREVVKAYSNAFKSLSNESIPLQSVSGDAATSIGKSIARNMKQRAFYLYDDKGSTTPDNIENVLDELDLTREELEERLSKTGISGYTQAGPTPGAWYVDIKGRRLMISPDEGMEENFRTSSMVNNIRKSLSRGSVKPFGDNYEILINPIVKKNGTVSWDYVEVIKDNNGNIIDSKPITLDKIREAERRKFSNSNYLGSRTDIMGDQETY